MTILVLLESPKISKVEKILGKGFMVKSSCGHISDLDKNSLSIDTDNNFKPTYKTYSDKLSIINDLKRSYSKCDGIILACDYDREGESIAWHVAETLKVPETDKNDCFS